jgi:hypothetical protein
VANVAACAGTKTWPIATPRQNMSSRIHHKLVCASTRLIRAIDAAATYTTLTATFWLIRLVRLVILAARLPCGR